MDVSTTSMNVASETVRAISQGFVLGGECVGGAPDIVAVVTCLTHSDPRNHGQAGRQHGASIFFWGIVKNYFHRYPLHHFHKISGGILRR